MITSKNKIKDLTNQLEKERVKADYWKMKTKIKN